MTNGSVKINADRPCVASLSTTMSDTMKTSFVDMVDTIQEEVRRWIMWTTMMVDGLKHGKDVVDKVSGLIIASESADAC